MSVVADVHQEPYKNANYVADTYNFDDITPEEQEKENIPPTPVTAITNTTVIVGDDSIVRSEDMYDKKHPYQINTATNLFGASNNIILSEHTDRTKIMLILLRNI